jgi:hypothetical protein
MESVMSHDRKDLRDLLWSMPIADVCGIACLRILDDNKRTIPSIRGMLAMIEVLAKCLTPSERIEVAEYLRDCADVAESRVTSLIKIE